MPWLQRTAQRSAATYIGVHAWGPILTAPGSLVLQLAALSPVAPSRPSVAPVRPDPVPGTPLLVNLRGRAHASHVTVFVFFFPCFFSSLHFLFFLIIERKKGEGGNILFLLAHVRRAFWPGPTPARIFHTCHTHTYTVTHTYISTHTLTHSLRGPCSPWGVLPYEELSPDHWLHISPAMTRRRSHTGMRYLEVANSGH